MLSGWVTYEELRYLTGFNPAVLNRLIKYGVRKKVLTTQTSFEYARRDRNTNCIYNLADFEKCLSVFGC